MRILVTGAAGSLGTELSHQMRGQGHQLVGMDIKPRPAEWEGDYTQGSITDRSVMEHAMSQAIDAVVHIAAYHGVHERPVRKDQQPKDAYAFWDLNVNGTFHVFEAAARAGVRRVVYISSTCIPREQHGIYGHTKAVGEQIANTYAHRHGMRIVTLRPRGFVPHTDHAVYKDWLDWAQHFWKGGVHIQDVAKCVQCALVLLARSSWEFADPPVCVVDGKIDYSEDQLRTWDAHGAGTTFRHVYGDDDYELARKHGLDPSQAPRPAAKLPDHTHTAEELLGFRPQYSIKNILEELRSHGASGTSPSE